MRNGILAMLLTVSAGSGWATGQQYLPGYAPHPAYKQTGATPGRMVPPNAYRQFEYPPQRTSAYPGYGPSSGIRPVAYYARPFAPVSHTPQPHVLANGQSPPIEILNDAEIPRPLPAVETQAPEILTFPPTPNRIVPTPNPINEGGNPPVETLPIMPKETVTPNGVTVDPNVEGETPMPTEEAPAPGSPILYGEEGLGGRPECYPECIDPPVAAGPVVIPPIKPLGYKFYGGAEYLFWWVRGQSSPVLLNFGPVPSAFPVSIGGGELPFDDRQRSGIRGTLGMWLDRDQYWGVEAASMYLFERSPSFAASSPPALPLSRPFINSNGNIPSAVLVAATGILTGTARIESHHELWSAEVNVRRNVWRCQSWWFDMFAGFRWLDLNERLNIDTNSTTLATGAVLAVSDHFATSNEVAAAQFGMQGEWQFWRMFVNAYGKTAFGNNRQTAIIEGSRSFTTVGGAPVVTTGGLLAQASNIGRHTRNQFSLLNEVGVNLGFAVSDSFRMAVGYTFLYVTDVARPGDQINTRVNPTQGAPGALGAPAPIFEFAQEDYWAHGLNFLLEFRY